MHDPENGNCNDVADLFNKNVANFRKGCGPIPALDYLQHLYGWAAFDCPGFSNDLAKTPSAHYSDADKSHHALQYDYQ
jgi:hypothetical protein